MKLPTIDRNFYRRSGSPFILLISFMMLLEVGLFLIWPSAFGATPLLILLKLTGSAGLTAALILVFTSMAIFGTVCRIGWPRYLILVWQQMLLGFMALGYVIAALQGHYLDSTPMDWPHITAEAIIITTLWLIHLVAIIIRARDQNG